MRHGSLFSGIGGFDLAASRMGWDNIFQIEIDPFCRRVLEKNFPDAQRFSDIRDFSGGDFAGKVDIISGGFPCQPFSVAGQRRGKSDDRTLWGEMLRVVRAIRPTWIVGENVAGIVSMELDTVLADLEGIGYTCQAFVIPACAVGAIHRRDRVWIIAHFQSPICEQSWLSRQRRSGHPGDGGGHGGAFANFDREREQQQERVVAEIGRRVEYSDSSDAPNALRQRCKKFNFASEPKNGSKGDVWHNSKHTSKHGAIRWNPDSSDILRAAYGLPGRVDGRNARIKGLGNAIVPQVAYNLFYYISLLGCG